MRGIAEQRDLAARPAGPRLAVVQHPVLALADIAEHLLHLRSGARKDLGQLLRTPVVVPLAACELAAHDGGHVVHDGASPQPVLHQVQIRPDPDHHVVEVRPVLHLVDRNDAAVTDVPDRLRRAVADHDLAHARAQPVRAYQRPPLVLRAVRELRDNAFFPVGEAHEILGGVQRDLLAPAAGFQQRAVQVAAMHDGIGGAEMPAERLAAGDARELAVGERIDEDQALGEHGLRLQVFHDAQPVEHAVGVRTLLDAVADLAELGRLLEHARAHAAARERERCRHAADAAADDEDFLRGLGAHGLRILHPGPRLATLKAALQWFMSYEHASSSFAWKASSFTNPADYLLELTSEDRGEMLVAVDALERSGRLSPVHALTKADFRFGGLRQKLERGSAPVGAGKGFGVLGGP